MVFTKQNNEIYGVICSFDQFELWSNHVHLGPGKRF